MSFSNHWIACLALILAPALAPAQTPTPPDVPDARTVDAYQGVVRLYLVNEFGEVEGVIATDGTQVRFPPHMGPDLVRTLKPGDRFVAQGRGVGGRGFRAYAIGSPNAVPLVEARPSAVTTPLPPEVRASRLTAMDVDGAVDALLYGPRGEIDGVLMDDATIVRLPPRSPVVDAATLRVGSKLVARGYGTSNRFGRSLRAEQVGLNGQPPVALQPRGPAVPARPPATATPPTPPPPERATPN